MNLYLSEFCVGKDLDINRSIINEATKTVINYCKLSRIQCWRSKKHDGYEIIETRIGNSVIFVAIIDKYWMSSTWKLHEFTYASGGVGIATKRNGKIVPYKIVFLSDDEFPSILRGCPGKKEIVRNIQDLKKTLNEARSYLSLL